MGDAAFKLSVSIVENILEQATGAFPDTVSRAAKAVADLNSLSSSQSTTLRSVLIVG